ncbi:hypothetical protein DRJ48_00130 [Candidatus Woesearchaeota archaeon]|nr:hypothetical protein [Candidatus Woesearchaeota archaeon]RLE43736.1 MAG: hypothetical protein DRJ48_00130 [Candidatus Woesearchaeota archaeon]
MPGVNEEDIIEKYKRRIASELLGKEDTQGQLTRKITTQEYQEFKRRFLPKPLSIYEKACNIAERVLKIKPGEPERSNLLEAITISHLEVNPEGVVALSYLGPILVIVFGGLLGYAMFQSLFFVLYFALVGLLLMLLLKRLPYLFANSWRLKASNQMVQCIFYVVTYMRHTSNFENAIEFAAEHLSPPLSLDLRKVLWDVETGKYDSIKESLDAYLETWRKWNLEFIEAFHLIESSLYEPSEERRLALIEKALEVILNETYEKMLHYTHELKSPITILHMLGIILPILGLVILPMVTSFMTSENLPPGRVALYLAVLYNITLPIIVYIFGRVILTKRPTGYGETDISSEFPEYNKYKYVLLKFGKYEFKINPLYIALAIGMTLALIGLYPWLYHFMVPESVLLSEKPLFMNFKIFGYKMDMTNTRVIGPYGLGAVLMSLFLTAGVGLGVGIYYMLRSKNVIKIREDTKQLETEFASGLFQLGNRIGDGIPTEIAFQNVAEVMKDTKSGAFFRIVANNITNTGMNVRDAIFNKKNGALVYFPSNVIKSSMKVLLESSKKGPQIASRTLLTVAEYIKEIHRVNERLRDLMADIISSMKQQINFMAPVISGIVIGITSMIVNILSQLRESIKNIDSTTALGQGGMGVLSMFGDGVPAYHFQIIVGLYVVEIVWVMTILVNGIENGADKLSENYLKGQHLTKSTLLYCIITFVVILIFNIIASTILQTSQIVHGV